MKSLFHILVTLKMMYSTATLLVVLGLSVSSTQAKLNELELSSPTYKITPPGTKEGINDFFYNVNKLDRTDKPVAKSLRSEAEPNVPLPLPEGYVEVVPQLPVAGEFLEKEMYIQNTECSIGTFICVFNRI